MDPSVGTNRLLQRDLGELLSGCIGDGSEVFRHPSESFSFQQFLL
jgi:regulator of sirC expression with transglutaminase-like and TPR domain